jgi:hypothetical protein
MTESQQRRWLWWSQIHDAAVTIVGIAILGVMTFRNSFPIPGVVAALVCIGSLSASAALRYLLGRWDPPNAGSSDRTPHDRG